MNKFGGKYTKDKIIQFIKKGKFKYLIGFDFKNADLEKADLKNAYLVKANLQNANLKEANLYNAYLSFADLRGALLISCSIRQAETVRGMEIDDKTTFENPEDKQWCLDNGAVLVEE